MALEIGSETQGDFRILRLTGRLDTETSADFELAAHDLTTAGDRRFVVDLSGISYVSSAGLRVLLALAKQTEAQGGALRLSGMSHGVRQVFDLSGFSKLFSIAPDVNGALRGESGQSSGGSADVSKAAANLLGASASSQKSTGSSTGRQAADLLGARQPPKRGLWQRIVGWFKGQ